MRLLHLIPTLGAAGSGPAVGLRQLAAALSGQGHQVHIATLDDPQAPTPDTCGPTIHALGPMRFSYGYAPRLRPWLREHANHFDAVIVEGLWQYHGFAAWRELRDTNTPYFVFTHGMLSPWFKQQQPLKHLKKRLYWLPIESRVLRDARAVLFTAENERILARQSFRPYRCRERVVGYGILPPPAADEAGWAALVDRHPELLGKRLLLFVGRLHPVKGCDVLVEAFARTAARDPSLHLVIAGPDQTGWRPALEGQAQVLGIANRITWPGMLDGVLKWALFQAAEALVLPSHQENFGVVVAEALACGKPVLISDKVNIWREIETGGAGIVSTDDVDGAAQSIDTWLSLDENGRQAMSERARACFAAHFHIDHAARQLVELLREECR